MKPYNNSFWDFNNGGNNKRRAQLYRGRAWLYFCYENSGHLPFLPAAKGSARTPLGPKLKEMVDYGVLEEYWQQHSNN